MSKWIAEFDLEDGDTMPEHMDLNYMGTKLDFHCRPMWIPVSERLPEESLNSLIGWDSFRKKSMFVQFFNGHFQITGKVLEPFDIKAWMPMPIPYEEVENDE